MKIIIYVFLLILVSIFFGCKDSSTGPVTNNYYYNIDSLSNPNIMPKVIFTNPANGAVGPFFNDDSHYSPTGPQITIQFNKLINILNLSSNSILLSTNEATYYLTLADNNSSNGYASPFLRDILIFNVGHKYLANKVYTVTVDTTLLDVHGKRLSSPYVFSYTPEPQFRVYSGNPSSSYYYTDGINPGSFSPVVIDLNSKVDTTFFSKIQISPSISGKWVFYPYSYYNTSDSTTVYFISTDTLLFDTKYTVTVAGSAKDANGLTINAPYQFSFTTQPFEVSLTGWSSSTGPGGFTVFSYLDYSFNSFIDTSTVRSSISITPSLSFDLSFNFYNGGCQSVYVNPNLQQMQRNTTYKIIINNTVCSRKGIYLKNPYSYSIVTGS